MVQAHCLGRVQGHRGEEPVNTPIGVFDSGVGGLSILQALQRHMPAEDFVYMADSAHAPYGERDAALCVNVQGRSGTRCGTSTM
jgi:glutamate racemase